MQTVTPGSLAELKGEVKITPLGKGGFGQAFKVKVDGKQLVIKIVNKPEDIKEIGYSIPEIIITCSYRHRNLLRGIGVSKAEDFSPEFKGRGLAIASRLHDSDLRTFMSNKEYKGKGGLISLDMIHGYRALRELGWIHGDLKPENTLIRTGGKNGLFAVIADFGTVRPIPKAGDIRKGRTVGTPRYMPPEATEEKKLFDKEVRFKPITPYSEAFDMWSLGVIFIELLPEMNTEEKELLKPVLEKIFIDDPTKRMSFGELLESDFYTLLIREFPTRKYVQPYKVGTVKIPSNIGDITKNVIILEEAIKQLAQKNSREISVEVIARAHILIWLYVAKPFEKNINVVASSILWMAYKITNGFDSSLNYFLWDAVIPSYILTFEQQFIIIFNQFMPSNSLFDLTPSKSELDVILGNNETSINLTKYLIESTKPLNIFSLNSGDKNIVIKKE